MKKTLSLAGLLALALSFATVAQTNPTAVSLPFTLNSQTLSTPPAGVAIHKFSSIPTSRTLSPGTADLPNQGSSPALATGGWYNLGTDGIGLLASNTNEAGAVVVAINTTGLNNVSVSWICKTIKNQASRDNSIALQYRIGTSGNFINVGTTSTYSSAGNANGHSSAVFTELLPAGANNQALVQVRWVYWESVNAGGSRDKISVDDISMTASSSGTTCGTPTGLAASGISTSGAGFSWSSVAGASSYEYAVTTSATPPASGTATTATSGSASSLTPNTLYYVHVRSVCSGSQFSGWTTISFTTAANPGDESEFVVMTYNLLNYPGSTGASREPSYRTIVDGIQPDIMVVQEVSSPSGIGSFLNNVLNFSSTTYSQGTFIDGPDTDNGIYYKTAKFQFISNTPIQTDLRDINQFTLKHLASGDTLIIFSAHLKASDTPSDEALRAQEADSLRKVTNTFAAGKNFIVCGDFNIYGASEAAYVKLTGNGSNANGKFNDLLSMPGTWNNSAYAINHTQSPRTTAFGGGATGGMDDRFDMLLFSTAITQTGGIDIVSGSYKAYGNDGMHYNQALNTPPYTLYSSATAAAIHDASDHLPVIVTLKHTAVGPKSTGINAMADDLKISVRIYPNPAHTLFFIQANTELATPVQFYLYDVSGRIVKEATLSSNTKEALSIDVTDIAPGMYYLTSDQLSGACKIMVN